MLNEQKINENTTKQEEFDKENKEIKELLQKKDSLLKLNSIDCQDGIFKYLFDECGMSPIDKGIITIEGNSFNSEQQSNLLKIIDPKTDIWVSEDKENSYIKINFVNSLVKINKYKLIVGNTSKENHFNSWTLSAITENNQEIVLDDVSNCGQIKNGQTQIITNANCSSFIKSIKLTMKGKSSWKENPYRMIICNIELFGLYSIDQ